jgi:hypothetical protein
MRLLRRPAGGEREDWGFAADHLLLGRAHTEGVADHNEPGSYGDAHLQGDTGSGFELRHGLDQRKPGANRALGVMPVGLRISDIGEHPSPMYLATIPPLRSTNSVQQR